MTVFDEIVKASNDEDLIRSDPSLITNNLVKITSVEELNYVNGNFGDKIVLTGSNKRDTICDDFFNMEFSRKTFDLLTYVHWDNIVVAGGSLVNIITKCNEKLNDIDIFIYGLDNKSAKKKVDSVINSIKQKAIDMKYDTRVYMNKNVINIYVFDTKKLLQVQIILRLYDTLAHVLIGFDVDCCCACYDGKNIMVSERGKYALKYRVNIANLKRRSPSYENRLIKYSFRGFDVVTDFKYENMYNKMFFMASENYGFTRLLEQEIINNGQLKNIIFSNTLKFKQTSSYTTNHHSSYGKEKLEIKDVKSTENCITKFNANIEDDMMKFKEYSMKNVEFMEIGVMEQFTGSFDPVTDENWIDGKNEGFDPLKRSQQFINLKYNLYENISEFEDVNITDISNFDAKCMAVMYVANDNDVVKIVENKNVPKTNNMYKISPTQLAILLGRTKLAIKLMKSYNYDSMKELIYMVDNDKLFTNYCNAMGISCTNIDKYLVSKYDCENISDNIHNQNRGINNLEEFYKLTSLEMLIKLGLETVNQTQPQSNTDKIQCENLDITKLSYDTIKFIYEKGFTSVPKLMTYVVKKFKSDDIEKFESVMNNENEKLIFKYMMKQFESNEKKRCIATSENVIKLLTLKNLWNNDAAYSSIYDEFNKLTDGSPNLYTCMINIRDPNLTHEIVNKLLTSSKSQDILINYILFLDDISLIQKMIPKDDLYVKLKYNYRVESNGGPNILEFFTKIETDRQNDKVKTNKILKNTDDHIDAINDGDLRENYVRCENVFGMTPDDNVIAKLLLMYNKIFNKGEHLSDKDKTTLKNMRKTVHNIRRNNEYSPVETKYFYSLDLHNLFFKKDIESDIAVVDKKDNSSNKTTLKHKLTTIAETSKDFEESEEVETDSDNEIDEEYNEDDKSSECDDENSEYDKEYENSEDSEDSEDSVDV